MPTASYYDNLESMFRRLAGERFDPRLGLEAEIEVIYALRATMSVRVDPASTGEDFEHAASLYVLAG